MDPPILPPLATPDSFLFPYSQPYSIQLDLMRTVFRAIEERKIAIVESPTGTGKSLTLLTSTLTWLTAHAKRLDEEAEIGLRAKLAKEQPDDPEWVIEHAVKSQLRDQRAAQTERAARIAAARERERKNRLIHASGTFRTKKSRPSTTDSVAVSQNEGDEAFLPEDNDGEGDEEGAYLTPEVRVLMAKLWGMASTGVDDRYDALRPKAHVEDEIEEDIPKIYYTSRTHTQLRQLTSELLKTSFVGDETAEDPEEPSVSLVPLGSRKQLCINPRVRQLAKSGGDERLNEACLDMQKSGSNRCDFLPAKADEGAMLDARDAILAEVRDIEDIVQMGTKSCVCPYYATRRAVRQAQLVTLPYNLLLQKNAREALEIDLKDQIVVIDEAHNLIDTLLSIHSTTLTANNLANAISQLRHYLHRFKSRLKPIHALWIKQTLSVLSGLSKVCTAQVESKVKSEMLDTNALMARAGGGADQVNLLDMVKYLKDSKLARKVSGFTERTAEEAALKDKTARGASSVAKHAATAAFHLVEAFLLSLTDARDDGRVILATEDGKTTLRYILLNPAERFREVVEQARCVILAGGTMEPISDFLRQLFPFIPKDRISTLSCAHVIPKANLLTQVVSCGPRKVDFEFKFANRGDESLVGELGAVILSTVGLVPDGVVVFVPSYAFLDKIKAAWSSCVLPKLSEKKHVFYEPQTSGGVEEVLRDYSLAISTPPAEGDKRKGALLFAVVGGKLSEGINFSDRLGRCVIMVGLPFANVGSVELSERMKYVSGLPGAGPEAAKELYENLCMRAVNQSIGRAIRHANDYATILLVDRRYSSPRIRKKLPKWIGDDLKVPSGWSEAARGIAGFFRERRGREMWMPKCLFLQAA